MNTRIAVLAIALLQSGMQTFVKICHSEAPSSSAASISDFGIRLIYFVSRNTLNVEKIPGSMIAALVFKIPSHLLTRKFGTRLT